ncbi:hypothetical protein GCM10010421_09480 [Streptomyces glaucus]|uniref:Uncharacterized protein n=1 Tax=Streptomyces glaucus TaxID=284029 RepID=A0ABP5WF90_9ACTN
MADVVHRSSGKGEVVEAGDAEHGVVDAVASEAAVAEADYAAAFALVTRQRLRTPTTTDDLATDAASQDPADRLAHFADAGLLDTDAEIFGDHRSRPAPSEPLGRPKP